MSMSPRLLRPRDTAFSPRSISGLALWLDASSSDLYTTDAGPVSAVASPLDIAGCALWLDGADSSAASMTLDGTAVSSWRDKSGNGRDVSATGSERPTLTSNYQGTLSAVTFDGGDVLYRASGGLPIAPSTTFIVFDETTAVNFAGVLVGTPSSGDDFPSTTGFITTLHDGSGNTAIIRASNNQAAGGTALSTSTEAIGASAYGKRLASFVTSSSTASARLAGLASGTPDSAHTASGSSVGLLVGGRFISGAVSGLYRFNGKICEIVHYDSALSAANIARVEAYLAAKWAISGVHTPATASSDPVGYWADKSGNSRHVTTSDASTRPVIHSATHNGRKVLDFDGVNDTLSRDNYTAESDLTGLTRFGVFYSDSGAGPFHLSSVYNGGSYSSFASASSLLSTHAGLSNSSQHANVSSVLTAGTIPRVFCARYDGTAGAFATGLNIILDGAALPVASTTGTFPSSLPGGSPTLFIGSNIRANNFLNGKLCEYISYARALTTAERQRVERYLAARWGITLAPQVSNADAQDWINRVYANGGTVSSATAASVNTLCESLESASLRDRFYRLNLFCGTGLNAALVPLYLTPDKTVTNLFQFGTDQTNAVWLAGGNGAITRAASTEVGPLGYGYATKLTTPSAPFDVRQMYQQMPTTGQQATVSAWMKTNTGTKQIQWMAGGPYSDTVTVTSTWQRFTKTFTLPSSGDSRTGFATVSELNDAGHIFVWGMQCEYGATATSYNQPRYGNTTDTNNAFVGVGTDYAETGATGGLKGNGSTKRLDTGLAGSTLTPGDRHLAHYQSLAATKDYAPSILSGPAFGSTSSQHAIGPWTAISQHYYRAHATIGGNANVASNANGFYVGIDTSSTASRLRRNGSQIASTSGQTAANSGTTNYFIFGNGESSDARLNAYSIGLSMTDEQAEAYNTAMQAFQASLTRNV